MKSEAYFAKVLLDSIPPLVRLIRSELKMAAPQDLTVPQFRVLAQIHHGINTVSEIAEMHVVSQPAMTKMVGTLVRRGFIHKKVNQKNTRQIHLSLTTKGQLLHNLTWQSAQRRIAKKFKDVPEFERELIINSLLKLQSYT
jgi:DNA-binding MarR family transcriptional regulator